MTGGDCVALCLAREDGVNRWKEAMGPRRTSEAMRDFPNSLRARYGDPGDDLVNALHGSDSPEESEREIEIIFPHILHGGEGGGGVDDRSASPGSVNDELEQTVAGTTGDNKRYLER